MADYTKLYQNVNIVLDVNELNRLTYIYYLFFQKNKKPSTHHRRQARPIATILER